MSNLFYVHAQVVLSIPASTRYSTKKSPAGVSKKVSWTSTK